MLHRTRDLLIRQRTQLINALRAHLAELGLVAAKGREGLHQLVTIVMESCDEELLSDARFACQAIVRQLHAAQTQINGLDKRIIQAHRVNADSKRLNAIPGFGVILSTAVVATMTDPKAFKTGREFAAWIGLVPGHMTCTRPQAESQNPLTRGRRPHMTPRRHRRLKIAVCSLVSVNTQTHLRHAQTSWRQPARKEPSPGAAASNRMDSSTSSANGTER
jgi:hypothetical protein